MYIQSWYKITEKCQWELEKSLGRINLIPSFNKNKIVNKSSITSHFVASLELAKNGFIELKQEEMFGNIFIKSKFTTHKQATRNGKSAWYN